MSEFKLSDNWKELFAAARQADKGLVFSPSKIADFNMCPRKYKASHITKEVQFTETTATRKGNADHKSLENRLAKGLPLPTDLKDLEATCQYLESLGKCRAEYAMGLNSDLSIGTYFGKGDELPMMRMKLDVTIINGHKGWVWDWKTGKVKDDTVQVCLNMLGVFSEFPNVTHQRGGYIWTSHSSVTPYENNGPGMFKTRKDIPALIKVLEIGTIPIMEATIEGDFEPKRNFLCEKWCEVKSCPFNGKSHRS